MVIVNRQKAIAKVKNIRHIKNSRIDNNNQHKELRLSTKKRSNYITTTSSGPDAG